MKFVDHIDTVKVRKRVVVFNVYVGADLISYIHELFLCPDDALVLQLESELFLTIVG